MLNIVIDTNVLFEGLTKRGSVAELLVNAWLVGSLPVYVSTALALEYVDVLSRKLSPQKWQTLQPVLNQLLSQAHYTPIYYSWRPASPDPGDDQVIDCAMNVNAVVVTFNQRDFQLAKNNLGLVVMSPLELVTYLA